MFALHQSMKVFSQVFFKKLAGLGRAHKKRRFLFAKLFLCASRAKEKAELWFFMFLRGENFLKRKLFPTPLSKNFEKGFYLFVIV